MKKRLLLLYILPILLFACSPAAVEIANTEVPASPTSLPEPTALPDPTAEPVEEAASEEAPAEETSAAEVAATESEDSATFTIDTANSTLTWTGAKAVGDSHTGTIDLSSGEMLVAGDALVSGMFEIDMTTIHEGSARLENHLKSDDFFGVESYPTATLEILETSADSAETYTVRANLTIKDITNEITFPATASVSGDTLSASANIIFDRSLWDVQYGSGSFFSDLGNDLINDEIELVVELVATP